MTEYYDHGDLGEVVANTSQSFIEIIRNKL